MLFLLYNVIKTPVESESVKTHLVPTWADTSDQRKPWVLIASRSNLSSSLDQGPLAFAVCVALEGALAFALLAAVLALESGLAAALAFALEVRLAAAFVLSFRPSMRGADDERDGDTAAEGCLRILPLPLSLLRLCLLTPGILSLLDLPFLPELVPEALDLFWTFSLCELNWLDALLGKDALADSEGRF